MTSNILTISGRYFDLQHPDHSIIDIRDIAHALSHLCRFTGHTHSFYSVAQHSVLVSRFVPEHLALEGLLHDASEAYLGDVSSPLKALLPDYRKLEEKTQQAIAEKFNLSYPFSPEIYQADKVALAAERRDLMAQAQTSFQAQDKMLWENINRYGYTTEQIVPLAPDRAMEQFIDRYEEIEEIIIERPDVPRERFDYLFY